MKKPPETESFDAAELGAMMREMRQNLGYELDGVARDLRIRLVYLEAIESGRLSDLPGNAYVSGFLRSYSNFLGFEGAEIVRRFKIAGAQISNQPQLHLPSPVEEGRLPTASILLVAAVIAALAYGGWYYLSDTGSGPMKTVASLPRELLGLVNGIKNPTGVAERSGVPGTMPAPESVEKPFKAAVVPTIPNEPNVPGAPTVSPKEASVAPPVADPTVDNAARTAVTLTPTPSPASAPKAARNRAPTKTASQAPVIGGIRIVLRATTDSYVVVRTGENKTLFSELMRRGDSYEVPPGANLILETGNAGGLQVTVGGKRAPSLGQIGEIRRNVPLDAEKLFGGGD